MRNLARILPLAALAVALTACNGAAATHSAGTSGPATSAAAPSTSSVAAPSTSSVAAPSTSSAATGTGPLGALPLPAGARPWTNNTGKPVSLKVWVQRLFIKSAWSEEDGLNARRGFKSGAVEGWIDTDGSQQEILLARFATAQGARSLYDGLTTGYKGRPKPWTVLADTAVGGMGSVDPTLDALGNAQVEIAAVAGDVLIIAKEYTAATPDAAADKALMLRQYDRLKTAK